MDFAAELAAAARDQHVVLLVCANASLNEEAGIHCGGSEASMENTAGTTFKELVAERAPSILQTFSKFGPTWHNRWLDFIAVPFALTRLSKLLWPLARSARRAVSQDKAEWLKRKSARIRAEAVTGSSRTLWHVARQLSGSKKARGPRPVAAIAAGDGTPLLDEAQVGSRWGSSRAAGSAFSSRISKADSVSCALRGKTSLAQRSGLMRISWPTLWPRSAVPL